MQTTPALRAVDDLAPDVQPAEDPRPDGRGNRDWKTTLAYRQPRPDVLLVEGPFDGHRVRARLRLTEPPELLLVTRGFHWINERPLNR